MQIFVVFVVALLMMGCATTAHQTEELLKSPLADLAARAEIANMPFVNQDVGHCGPATLAMVLHWQGKMIPVADLVKQVYTPGMKGSFQTDMISASRRQGMMAVQIQGLPALLQEISAGHPVIVFENLAFTWLPQYHYAVVYGYDLNEEVAIMHSGPENAKRWDLRKFERSWMLGDYWGLVVLKPGELAAAGSELAHVTAAAGLEQLTLFAEAERAYLAILKRWPTSLGALVGMGNITYTKMDYKKSVEYLRLAIKNHPDSLAARNNLSIAEKAGAIN